MHSRVPNFLLPLFSFSCAPWIEKDWYFEMERSCINKKPEENTTFGISIRFAFDILPRRKNCSVIDSSCCRSGMPWNFKHNGFWLFGWIRGASEVRRIPLQAHFPRFLLFCAHFAAYCAAVDLICSPNPIELRCSSPKNGHRKLWKRDKTEWRATDERCFLPAVQPSVQFKMKRLNSANKCWKSKVKNTARQLSGLALSRCYVIASYKAAYMYLLAYSVRWTSNNVVECPLDENKWKTDGE